MSLVMERLDWSMNNLGFGPGYQQKMLLNSHNYQLTYNREFILSLYYYDVIIVIHS
jgi:hypothetical protein